MKIIICGASGLIGQALTKNLSPTHRLTLVGRNINRLYEKFGKNHQYINWEKITANLLSKHDVIINLAGENIGEKRWSNKQKNKILKSRTDTTSQIATLCADLGKNSPRIMNASAIGIYGSSQNNKIFNESTAIDNSSDFLQQVSKSWEAALNIAVESGASVTILRFGVVLSNNGGVLKKLLPSAKFGLSAILGDGEQKFSWVAIDDLVSAINFLLENPTLTGPINIVADEIVSQKVFSKTLAALLHRPCIMRMPTYIVKLLFGEMGQALLLNSISVESKKLKKAGFAFKYPTINEALTQILHKRKN